MRYEELTDCPGCGISHPVGTPVMIACSVYCPMCARDDILRNLEWLPPRDWLHWVRDETAAMPPVLPRAAPASRTVAA